MVNYFYRGTRLVRRLRAPYNPEVRSDSLPETYQSSWLRGRRKIVLYVAGMDRALRGFIRGPKRYKKVRSRRQTPGCLVLVVEVVLQNAIGARLSHGNIACCLYTFMVSALESTVDPFTWLAESSHTNANGRWNFIQLRPAHGRLNHQQTVDPMILRILFV